jgi:hypothetical protein
MILVNRKESDENKTHAAESGGEKRGANSGKSQDDVRQPM